MAPGGVSSLPAIHGLADDRAAHQGRRHGPDRLLPEPHEPGAVLHRPDQRRQRQGLCRHHAGERRRRQHRRHDRRRDAAPEVRRAGTGQPLSRAKPAPSTAATATPRVPTCRRPTPPNRSASATAGATAKSDNYEAGGDFKTFDVPPARRRPYACRDEVGSTAYETRNHSLGLALKGGKHLVEAKVGYQDMPYELYPNQRMDMLDNEQCAGNLRYLGQFGWGTLEARAYHENVDHFMDFGRGQDVQLRRAVPTEHARGHLSGQRHADVHGRQDHRRYRARANIDLNRARSSCASAATCKPTASTTGGRPAPDCGVGNCIGGMAPLTFWNINDGKRDRSACSASGKRKWSAAMDFRCWACASSGSRPTPARSPATTAMALPDAANIRDGDTGTCMQQLRRHRPRRTAPFNAMDRKRTDTQLAT